MGHEMSLFSDDEPLGPAVMGENAGRSQLLQVYDTSVHLHVQARHSPPAFIIGRRGAGKTALLLSTRLDEGTVDVMLSRHNTFQRVQVLVDAIDRHLPLTEEGVADIWRMVLWAPVATRLAILPRDRRDPRDRYTTLWAATASLRPVYHRAVEAYRQNPEDSMPPDDAVLVEWLKVVLQQLSDGPRILGTDELPTVLRLGELPFSALIGAAEAIIAARKADVVVMIDSLENLGPLLDRVSPSVKGLFNLIGRMALPGRRRSFAVRCCFPSEMWAELERLTAAPLKDLSSKLVLRWRYKDLQSIANSRLEAFMGQAHPDVVAQARSAGQTVLDTVLPTTVTNMSGLEEPVLRYMTRHTQMLPRQFIYILNQAIARALAATGRPFVSEEQVREAVMECEANICPEIFSAHRFRFPDAEEVTRELIPKLPFQFDDGDLAVACRELALAPRYHEIRSMLTEIGVLGQLLKVGPVYRHAEFAYTVEGQFQVSPEQPYCLHPLFVRQFKSRDLAGGSPPMPVLPTQTSLDLVLGQSPL